MTFRNKSILLPAALLALGGALAQAQDQDASDRAGQEQNTTSQQNPDQTSPDQQTQARSQDEMANASSNGARQTSSSDESTSGSARQASSSDTSSSSNGNTRMAQAGHPAIITMLILPAATASSADTTSASTSATQAATQNGCWAKLYDDQNYNGDTFTLVGPVDMANMKGPFGADWSNIDSIQTGPNASVTLYDNTNFRDRAAQIKANQRVPELNEKLGFFEDVKSMRINCGTKG